MSVFNNRLINESSPYLLQHAHNPVDWYPWGEEALEKAKKEDKPLLVSIGYAACHWCHVMERESFENEETAALMNEHFINVKIDREERPDIDHIYMDAVQAMTGSGGWPLNVFLTPDGRPFYGGTYFPPVRAFNRNSWTETLIAVANAYKEKRHEIESQADNLTEHIRTSNAFGSLQSHNHDEVFKPEKLNKIAENVLQSADKVWGGFGNAPKFPQSFTIQFLLRHYQYTKDEKALDQALLSLDKMIYGGIYDQIGGGFARYSTDEKWLAPHFEKMLYDNALLIGVLAEAFQLTKKEIYKSVIHQTMQFITREMLHHDGGFYSALDADSEGVEGKFYTWSKDEIDEFLAEDSTLFCEYYDVSEGGNWEHTNILWVKVPEDDFVQQNGLDPIKFKEQVEKWQTILMSQRDKRIRPLLDDKILLAWNALMNIACCKAFAATGVEEYRNLALTNIQFLEKSFVQNDGEWKHTFKNDQAKYPAFLDDYAYLVSAYIHLQEITGDQHYLDKAKQVSTLVIDNFIDDDSELFFFTSKTQKDVILRKKEVYDGAIPSGNAVMASNLLYLGMVYENTAWIKQGKNMVAQFEKAFVRYPTSFGVWCCNFQNLVMGIKEIAVTGKGAGEMIKDLLREYIPGKILQWSEKESNGFALLKDKSFGTVPLIYVCVNYSCQKPVESIEQLKMLLK